MTATMQTASKFMQQYLDAKAACGDALLLFRMGDFYELFYDDAKTASRTLGLTLTSRDKGENPIPMAGFPYHQLESYLGKLIAAGFRAAVCEQVEDPKQAKGPVKREVTRVASPGTLTDDTHKPVSPFHCEKCGEFKMTTGDRAGYMCGNGHGRIILFESPDHESKYKSAERWHRFGRWVESFPVAIGVSGCWRLYDKRGIFRKGSRIPDGERPGDGFYGGRIDDQVYRFTKLSGDGYADEGYRRLSSIRGGMDLWDGNYFSDDVPYLCDGRMAISEAHLTIEDQEEIRALPRGTRFKQMDKEQSLAAWATCNVLGEEMDFLGWKPGEFRDRELFVQIGSGTVKFNANLAAWMRRVLHPDEYRILATKGKDGPVRQLQFVREGVVTGVLAEPGE